MICSKCMRYAEGVSRVHPVPSTCITKCVTEMRIRAKVRVKSWLSHSDRGYATIHSIYFGSASLKQHICYGILLHCAHFVVLYARWLHELNVHCIASNLFIAAQLRLGTYKNSSVCGGSMALVELLLTINWRQASLGAPKRIWSYLIKFNKQF